MSYSSHHSIGGGYGANTGAAYMARRGWDRDSDREKDITFHGSRSTRVVIIIVIGIFLVIGGSAEQIILPSTPTIPPGRIEYACSFVIPFQANTHYNDKSSRTYQTALQSIRKAVISTVNASPLQQYAPFATADSLDNNGENLRVSMTLTTDSRADPNTVLNVLRAETPRLQTAIGEIADIGPNSWVVVPRRRK